MTPDPSGELRVREVRVRDDDFVSSAVNLAGGVARLGLGLFKLPLGLLPRETQRHTLNAFKELSYAFASLPRDFADIAGVEIEKWVARGTAPALGPARARAAAAFELHATAVPIETLPASSATHETLLAPLETAAAPTADEIASLTLGLEAPVAQSSESSATGPSIRHVEFDPPGKDYIGEYVLIANDSHSAVDMTGWTLKDTSVHAFEFPPFVLPAGAQVKLWTRIGTNDDTNLFWGNIGALWNNAGDTAILLDATGAEISSHTYEGKTKA